MEYVDVLLKGTHLANEEGPSQLQGGSEQIHLKGHHQLEKVMTRTRLVDQYFLRVVRGGGVMCC